MSTKDILIERAEQQFLLLLGRTSASSESHDLAERYFKDAYAIEDTVSHLLALEMEDDTPGRIIKFNLIAAAGFVASLIGGIAGAGNPLILGSVIVSSIVSLTGLYQRTTPAEGLLFWIIYETENHEGMLSDIEAEFKMLSKKYPEITSSDFRPALRALINIGAIEQKGKQVKVIEKLVFLWFKEK